MDALLSAKRVSSFEQILKAYAESGSPLRNAIDGGAGSGSTSEQMVTHLAEGSVVHAFEPFPGNHRFFEGRDPSVILHKKALADQDGFVAFNVPAVVSEDSVWGRRGMAGYSSGGRILATESGLSFEVEAVAGDNVIPDPRDVDFIKLDLEGGEISALAGMPILLAYSHVLWVEFKGQPALLKALGQLDRLLFDTSYLFIGEPNTESLGLFEPDRIGINMSDGRTAWTGFRRGGWSDYLGEFSDCAKEFNMVQTDLVCVNFNRLDRFIRMLPYL